MSKCPGLKGAMVDGVCYNPSPLPCQSTPANPVNQVVVNDNDYNTGYCIPRKEMCPLGFTIGVNEVTGEENACYWPAACGLAKAGQFCHAATNTVNTEPCDPRETTFTMTTDRRQTIHVCAAYPLLQ